MTSEPIIEATHAGWSQASTAVGLDPIRLKGEVVWLYEHGVKTPDLGFLFQKSPGYIRKLIYDHRHAKRRGRYDPDALRPFAIPQVDGDPVSIPATLRAAVGVRAEPYVVAQMRANDLRIDDLEETVETIAAQFWDIVRFESGACAFRELLPEIGRPSHYRRIRLRARLCQILCELFLHSGRCASALSFGLKSLHLYRISYEESKGAGSARVAGHRQVDDLAGIARTARLISQVHLLRRETADAERYLGVHESACSRGGVEPRPEYFHQRATICFQNGDDEGARRFYQRAMLELSRVVDYGQARAEHEVRDIGERQLHLVGTPDFDGTAGALGLFEYMRATLKPGDIHVATSLAWTVSCGFSTDSVSVQTGAMDLLDRHWDSALGYRRQETVFRLLRMTLDIPSHLRSGWVRHVLYSNESKDL
jgi:hypothetical protein